MAQKDATETAKEVLRQIIKYRFWISISIAALVAPIAYFMGSGAVQEKAKAETNKITAAEKQVKTYTSPTIPTKEYEPIVAEKTHVLSKDVNSAWKTLFDRQAPLLTWPEPVQERFRKWGRQWPEKEAPSRIELAIVDYIAAYPSYVSMVYKTFNPFDYETGEGVVVAPPEQELLRPAQFEIEHLPGLGKVWAAQERLWIQRTLLEVVAQVNKNAKGWETGVIRQIVGLDVGNPNAQDQRSAAKNETLEEAPSIHAPGETDETAAAAGGGGGITVDRMRGARSGFMGGAGGGAGGGAEYDTVYYVKATSDKGQYKILPVVMTVLIDQDRVQDFLIELENSPMSIQVMDFELQRPEARVTKPEKGAMLAGGGFGGMMGMMMGSDSMMARRMGMGGMAAYGGMARQAADQMRASMMMSRGMQGMFGMGMGGADTQQKRQGKDVRGEDRSKKREETQKAIEQAKGPSLFDPYFDIVEVTVFGQARFFNPPPVEPAAQPSPGEAPAAPGSPAGSEVAKGAPAPSPPGTADQPQPDGAAPKAAEGAAPKGQDDAQDNKPAPKAADDTAPKGADDAQDTEPAPKAADDTAPKGADDAQDTKPAPKAGAAKTQPEGATAKP